MAVLVFIAISNHFPGATYGDRYNWAILAVLIPVGWVAANSSEEPSRTDIPVCPSLLTGA